MAELAKGALSAKPSSDIFCQMTALSPEQTFPSNWDAAHALGSLRRNAAIQSTIFRGLELSFRRT